MELFDWNSLTGAEFKIAESILVGHQTPPQPDLVIAPAGEAYLFRWHIVKTPLASVYFHIQVADDPKRPLHDHPWDNQSVILSGGYDEILHMATGRPTARDTFTFHRKPGDVVFRRAEYSHRLLMGKGVERTLTLFSTGPKRRDWGFWYEDDWRDWRQVTRLADDGKTSTHVKGSDAQTR